MKPPGEAALVEVGEAVGGVVGQADHLLGVLGSLPLPQHHPDHQKDDLKWKMLKVSPV